MQKIFCRIGIHRWRKQPIEIVVEFTWSRKVPEVKDTIILTDFAE